jgi:arylformamidase
MIAEITHQGRCYRIALNDPIDLSLPLDANSEGPRAWYAGPPRMEPVRDGDRTYMVKDGASTNFRDIHFNPHAHGTHTETVGHIATEILPIGPMLQRYFFTARLVTVRPEHRRMPDGGTDKIITLGLLRDAFQERVPEALVLRTYPNSSDKRTRVWSNTNPPYIEAAACAWLRSIGVRHLLVDLPSVDRERDEGKLAAHKAFWDMPATVDAKRTITEMIYVPDEVYDGDYILELQVPHFINDAAPSRPVLYALL